jgi:2'-5' RNA ligase
MRDTIRAFIAIELGAELRTALDRLSHQLEHRIEPGTVRWVKTQAMHLTLIFLGDTPVEQVHLIQRAIAGAARGFPSLSLTASGLGCYPNLRQPRVVWVGVHEPSGHLARLKINLDNHLKGLGFEPEQRPFSPHLTLGRVQKQASRDAGRKLGQEVQAMAVGQVGRITVDRIGLIRSDLKPTGPVYSTLASISLGQEP